MQISIPINHAYDVLPGGDGVDLVGGIVLDSFDTLAWGSFDQDFEGTSTSGERF